MLYLNISLLFIFLAGSFFFAGTETGMLTVNPLKVGYQSDRKKSRSAGILKRLLLRKENLLSSVLLGNNIVNVGATLSFIAVYNELSLSMPFLARVPAPESWILTPVVIVFCEMLPKSLYRIYSFKLTLASAPLIAVFYYLFYPLTTLFRIIAQPFGRKGSIDVMRAREHMVEIARQGNLAGLFFKNIAEVIENILQWEGNKLTEGSEKERFCLYSDQSIRSALTGGLPEHGSFPVKHREKDTRFAGKVLLMDMVASDSDKRVGDIMKPLPEMGEGLTVFDYLRERNNGDLFIIRMEHRDKLIDTFSVDRSIFAESL